MIKGLSHVCFVVKDLDRAVAFYTETLSLRHAFDFTGDDGQRTGAYLHFGARTFIELFCGKPGESNEGSFRHICVEVESMEHAVAEFRARGAEVSDPKTGSDGNPQAWLSDPDGNRIELHELRPEGLQARALARLGG
jgi:catechol 2,3-dioxygenase-like lactoylglutathione lyase family enzyme